MNKEEEIEKEDRLSSFMFGKRRPSENLSQMSGNEVPPEPFIGSDWLFGRRITERPSDLDLKEEKHELEDILNKVDLDEVMATVEAFMSTTEELKPLIDAARPYFLSMIKKFTEKN